MFIFRIRSLCSSHAFSSIKLYIKYTGRSLILSYHSSAAGKALYSLISSSATSAAALN
jgi:hypothetical protein